jgi:hypothetical protein
MQSPINCFLAFKCPLSLFMSTSKIFLRSNQLLVITASGIMLKDLAVELLLLVGLFLCILLFAPPLIYPWAYSTLNNGIIVFVVLLVFSVLQLRRLISKGSVVHAVAFATFMIATILFSFMTSWIVSRPLLL